MKKFVIAIVLTGFAGAAVAQDVEDTDGSGTYSMEELMVAYPSLTAEVYAVVDANGDGTVDADELAAAQASGVLAN